MCFGSPEGLATLIEFVFFIILQESSFKYDKSNRVVCFFTVRTIGGNQQSKRIRVWWVLSDAHGFANCHIVVTFYNFFLIVKAMSMYCHLQRLNLSSLCTQVKVLYPGFIQYVHENWLSKKGLYPSTGFMGLVLAMHICDEVGQIPSPKNGVKKREQVRVVKHGYLIIPIVRSVANRLECICMSACSQEHCAHDELVQNTCGDMSSSR